MEPAFVTKGFFARPEVIRAVSGAALRQRKVHPIILTVDVKDLGKGVFGRTQLDKIAPQIKTRPGVELVGPGTNVGCYDSVLPSVANAQILVEPRDYLNQTYGFFMTTE